MKNEALKYHHLHCQAHKILYFRTLASSASQLHSWNICWYRTCRYILHDILRMYWKRHGHYTGSCFWRYHIWNRCWRFWRCCGCFSKPRHRRSQRFYHTQKRSRVIHSNIHTQLPVIASCLIVNVYITISVATTTRRLSIGIERLGVTGVCVCVLIRFEESGVIRWNVIGIVDAKWFAQSEGIIKYFIYNKLLLLKYQWIYVSI